MAESIYPLVQEGTNHFAMIVFLQLGVRYRVVADTALSSINGARYHYKCQLWKVTPHIVPDRQLLAC